MRYVLAGAVAAILMLIAWSFFPGAPIANYENKALGLVSSITGLVVTLGALVTALLFGLRRPGIILTLVRGPNRPLFLVPRSVRMDEVLTRRVLLAAVGESSLTRPHAGHVIHVALAETEDHPAVSGSQPLWPEHLEGVSRRIQYAKARFRDSVIARFLIHEQSKIIDALLEDVVEIIEDIAQSHTVSQKESTLGDDSRATGTHPQYIDFRAFVTDFTGAIIFVDAVHSRAGYARGIRILHRGRFRNGSESGVPVSPGSYESSHVHPGGGECIWRQPFREQAKTKPDDFDGHVVEVLGASLTRDNRQSGVFFTIVTGESCYAATEVPLIPNTNLENPLRSKGLQQSAADKFAPNWVFDASLIRVHRQLPVQGRLALGVVSIFTIQEAPEGSGVTERSVVLLRRPSWKLLRNGGDVVAPPGGVMTVNSDSPDSDLDGHEIPDPIGTALNELTEEVGVTLTREAMVPVSVYLANDRGPREDSCQLVTSIAFQATLPHSKDELNAMRHRVSSHAGKYESVKYEFVDIPSEATLAEMTPTDKERAAEDYAASWEKLSPELDQRSIVGALYLGANLFGAENTIRAFWKTWDTPWYARNWLHDGNREVTELGRLARPISLLAPGRN